MRCNYHANITPGQSKYHAHIETNPKTTKNHPKIRPKFCQKSSRKSTKNHSKIVQNRPKVDPGGSGGHLRFPDPFWDRFGHKLGLHLGSFLRPSGGHVWAMLAQKLILGGPGWLSKSTMKFDTFSNRFGTDFGSILESRMEPKSVQDRSQERS